MWCFYFNAKLLDLIGMLMWICRVFISEWEWEIERTSTNSVFFNVYGAVSFFMIYLEKSRITFSGVPITSKFSHRLRTTELTYLVYCVGLGWAERFWYRKLTLIATLWKLSKLSIYFFFPSKLTHVHHIISIDSNFPQYVANTFYFT